MYFPHCIFNQNKMIRTEKFRTIFKILPVKLAKPGKQFLFQYVDQGIRCMSVHFHHGEREYNFSTLENFYFQHGSRYYLYNVLKRMQLGFLFRGLSLCLESLSLEMIKLNQQSSSGQHEILGFLRYCCPIAVFIA